MSPKRGLAELGLEVGTSVDFKLKTIYGANAASARIDRNFLP